MFQYLFLHRLIAGRLRPYMFKEALYKYDLLISACRPLEINVKPGIGTCQVLSDFTFYWRL